LNPGPPGCQPSRSSQACRLRNRGYHELTTKPLVDEVVDGVNLVITRELLNRFVNWLRREQKTGESTIKQYMYYLPKLEGLVLAGKDSVSKAFELMGYNKPSYEAFSRLLTFIDKKLEGYEDLVVKLRKAMPRKPVSRQDTYVPPDTRVRKLGKCLALKGEVYACIYNILVSSGCRGVEARYILENASRLKAVELDYGAVRLHLPPELQRGSKNEYVVYLPLEVWRQVKRLSKNSLPHQDTIENRFRDCGLALKYLRKWWRQKLKKLGIDSEDIEAFQGRTKTIGAKHYTDWIPILDEEYRRILKHVRMFLIY